MHVCVESNAKIFMVQMSRNNKQSVDLSLQHGTVVIFAKALPNL